MNDRPASALSPRHVSPGVSAEDRTRNDGTAPARRIDGSTDRIGLTGISQRKMIIYECIVPR
jgi:hypothetical protein